MAEFFDNPFWAIGVVIIVIAICMTIYYLKIDPRVLIMDSCTQSVADNALRISCADMVSKMTVAK